MLDICQTELYNYVRRKELNYLKKKIGRPTDNPKNERITVRLDDKSVKILERYCIQENVDKGEATRRAIKKLDDDLKK